MLSIFLHVLVFVIVAAVIFVAMGLTGTLNSVNNPFGAVITVAVIILIGFFVDMFCGDLIAKLTLAH